jgi:hypothetical protein
MIIIIVIIHEKCGKADKTNVETKNDNKNVGG